MSAGRLRLKCVPVAIVRMRRAGCREPFFEIGNRLDRKSATLETGTEISCFELAPSYFGRIVSRIFRNRSLLAALRKDGIQHDAVFQALAEHFFQNRPQFGGGPLPQFH